MLVKCHSCGNNIVCTEAIAANDEVRDLKAKLAAAELHVRQLTRVKRAVDSFLARPTDVGVGSLRQEMSRYSTARNPYRDGVVY